MKKSFLVLICVVFIAAVVAVGLFGLKYKSVYDDIVYPQSIECTQYRINSGTNLKFNREDEHFDSYAIISLDKSADTESTIIELLPVVTPVEAKDECTYTLMEPDTHAGITIDAETGVIFIDHAIIIKNGRIRGSDNFLVTVTSNQDVAISQTVKFYLQ